MFKNAVFFLVGIACFILLVNNGALANPSIDYSVGFINKTGHDLDEVSAYSSNRLWVLPTMLVAGGEATEGPMLLPVPQEAEVHVVDHGVHKAVVVSLKDVPKKGFEDGTIYFVINTNGTVDAKPIKFDDTDAAVKLVMSARPKGEYDFGFVNKTSRDLHAVSVYYGNQQVGIAGDILARVKVGYSSHLTLPIPSEAKVQWTEDDASHAVRVKLEDVVPQGYAEGTIFFIIESNDIIVTKPIKWDDDQGGSNLVR